MNLYKTTITIWSEFDPQQGLSLAALASEAECGDAYCSQRETQRVDPETDPDWDGTEFFEVDEGAA